MSNKEDSGFIQITLGYTFSIQRQYPHLIEKIISWGYLPRRIIIMNSQIKCGDCLQVLNEMPIEIFDLCFTSPPYYNARDYVHYDSYLLYLDFLRDVFKSVHKTLKQGRFLVINTSPVIAPRKGRQFQSTRYPIPFDLHPIISSIGFQFIDDILWVKPLASAKNRNSGFSTHRKPLTYKTNPIVEYVMVYRKQTDHLIDWNLKKISGDILRQSMVTGDYEKTNVWYISPARSKLHPAVFPQELVKRIIQFYSFIDEIILDPFAGIGTVGVVANTLKRKYFLIEKEENYYNIMKQKIGEKND